MRRLLRGFSLFETVIVLAVVGTLFAVSAGPLAQTFHGMRLQAFTADLLHPLMRARNHALKGSMPVTVCKSADGNACAAAGNWEQGWILFEDGNRNGTREPNERVLQQVQGLPAGWRIQASAPIARYVSYGPLGVTQLASGAFQAGTFTVCRVSLARAEARQVVLNAGGRPRVQKIWLDSCY